MMSGDDSRVLAAGPEGAVSRFRRLPTCLTVFVFERRFVVIVAPGQNPESRIQNPESAEPKDHSE
jgi:hypothetical protein